jgi:uncharacterized protein (TIGR04255 family)
VADWLIEEPEDRQLTAAPLTLAVCQVRHRRGVAASDPGRALCIQQDLDWESDLDEHVGQELSLNLVEGATLHSATHKSAQGWRFTSKDGAWTATVMPDFFALETTAYSGWTEFRSRLESVATTVAKHIDPVIENRVGLRYVNEIKHPDVTLPAHWAGFISGRLLQTDLLNDLNHMLRAALQVVEIRTRDDLSLVLRHGTQKSSNDERWQYTIDSDSSRQGARRFTPTELMATCGSLHRLALQTFEMATTPALRKYFEEG